MSCRRPLPSINVLTPLKSGRVKASVVDARKADARLGDVRGAYRALGLHGPAFMTGAAADHLRACPLELT